MTEINKHLPSIRSQVLHEQRYLERSANKYFLSQDRLRKDGQADQTDAIRYVIQDGLLESARILQQIVETQVRGIGAKYNQLVKLAAARVDIKTGEVIYDYDSIMYQALTVLFRAISNGKNNFTNLKISLASILEADAKARLFEAAYPGYFFTVMRSMKQQGVTKYEHIHKVIMTKFNHFELEWNSWNVHETNAVAQKVYNALLLAMPDIFFKHTTRDKNKTTTYIDTTATAEDWFADFEAARGLMSPSLPPMLIKPIDWYLTDDGDISGGYVTPRMANAVPFVKATNDKHKQFVKDNPPMQHIAAVNKMQRTAWEINDRIFEVQKAIFSSGKGGVSIPKFLPKELIPFPPELKNIPVEQLTEEQQATVLEWKRATKKIHTENRLNKSAVINYKLIFDYAREHKTYDKFYFVYNTDFRGRVYCATAALSPQGSDVAKGLLRFHEKIKVGERGIYWLAIHGANTYGNDKVSNAERVSWFRENESRWRRIIESPLDTQQDWGSADKPWQFLACLYEWAACDYGRNPDYKSGLPIGLDGSCNGIQHYSAILRDRVGGSGVNLRPSELPSDIYRDVAEELTRLLSNKNDLFAKQWLKVGITRKLTKRPVMTLPYGSTRTSAQDYIIEWMEDNADTLPWSNDEIYKAARYLTPLLWEAIGNIVIASRAAMEWIQKTTTKVLKKHKEPIKWLSPVGFPVYQAYYKSELIRVSTMLLGSIKAKPDTRVRSTYNVDTAEIDTTRQRSGIAPNFIHSIDASHMVRTINATDFHSYAMIHDDFGTHAGNTDQLWAIIRQEFVNMYLNHDPLLEWFEQQNLTIDPEYPKKGTLEITEVLDSTYFFG